MQEVIAKIEGLYKEMLEADKKLKGLVRANEIAAQDLKKREQAVADIESAKKALEQARQLTLALEQKQNDVDASRADFNNWKTKELEKIAKEVSALNVLKDREAELRKEKEELAQKYAELEKEKIEYRKRIKTELVQHFKNTKGNTE